MTHSRLSKAAASLVACFPLCALGADFSVSGFGTLGYVQSNQPYAYQRFIDSGGTLKRDSVLGLQLDAKVSNDFGATVQLKSAPSLSDDRRYEGSVSWAFLSYRPTNDLLLRVGKQRLPLYLYSETYDVSATYAFARLPAEMYTISPSNDFNGVSLGRTVPLSNGDLSIDGFFGATKTTFRLWLRGGPGQAAGPLFIDEDIKLGGVSIAYKPGTDTYRLNFGAAKLRRSDGEQFDRTYPFVTIGPGIGYYQVAPALPGPGITTQRSLTFGVASLGVDFGVAGGFRIISEMSRVWIPDVDISAASTRGYLSLLRRTGNWTPYVTYAAMRSASNVRDLYIGLSSNMVPNTIPGAALLNASQRAGADSLIFYDQRSVSVGTSYRFSAKNVMKAEFMRTRIGQGSSLVDVPPLSDVRNQNINVFSVSYSFVF